MGLYMWLNPDGKRTDIKYVDEFDFNSTIGNLVPVGMNLTTDILTVTRDRTGAGKQHAIQFYPIPEAGYEDVEYTINVYRDNELIKTFVAQGQPVGVSFDVGDYNLPDGTYEYTATVTTEEAFLYKPIAAVTEYDENFVTLSIGEESTGAIGNPVATSTIVNVLPKMKVIDFLRGIFNMFKLIIIPDELVDGGYYINTLEGYYAEGTSYDISSYIDLEQWDVERGEILNEINFKFQDPTTILNLQYQKNEGVGLWRLGIDST